jgi:hypothetical protein
VLNDNDRGSNLAETAKDIIKNLLAELTDAFEERNPKVRLPDEMVRAIQELQRTVPDRLVVRQARWKGSPALFALAPESPAHDGPEELKVVGRWLMDTKSWSPAQIRRWPELTDKRSQTYDIPVRGKDK